MSQSPAEYWEDRYSNGSTWSGKVNAALEREVSGITPGSALDLGSGEGGDALWLARNGWSVTAVDISPSALAIGAAAAQPSDDVTWVAADLATWHPDRTFDLVTACFLHSSVALPREQILREAARAVAQGGILLIVGHVGVPHWAHDEGDDHDIPPLPTPDEVLASLMLDDNDWTVLMSAVIVRAAVGHEGEATTIADSVLKLRRIR